MWNFVGPKSPFFSRFQNPYLGPLALVGGVSLGYPGPGHYSVVYSYISQPTAARPNLPQPLDKVGQCW
jgi:hypothetical protein